MNWQYRTGEAKGEKKTLRIDRLVEPYPMDPERNSEGGHDERSQKRTVLQQTKKPARRNYTDA
jgi:hypothetical protein